MRIGGVHSVQNALSPIGFAITIGIAKEQDVRSLNENNAVLVKLKTGGAVQVVNKVRALVGLAVAICIFKDEEAVALFAVGSAFRIIEPGSDPKTPFGVERHLDRV